MLLALAPCAPFAPAKVRSVRGDAAYMAAFIVLTAAGTCAAMPLAAPVILQGTTANPWAVARPLLLFVLLPLAAGSALRGLHPAAAERVRVTLAAVLRAATLGLLLLVVVVFGRGVLDAVGSGAIAVQVIFVAGLTLLVHQLGAVLPDAQRSVLTIGLSTRNLGAALAPLAAIEPDPRAIVMVAIAVPVTLAAAAVAVRVLAHPKGVHVVTRTLPLILVTLSVLAGAVACDDLPTAPSARPDAFRNQLHYVPPPPPPWCDPRAAHTC
jgi:BASS family bile acid:Na+ symporter